MLSEAGHWGVLDLGLLEGTLVQASVRICVCLGLGNLFGVKSYPQFVAVSVGLGCLPKGQSCTPKLGFTSTRPWCRSAKSQGTSRSASTYLQLLAAC